MDQRDEGGSKLGVPPCELDSEGGEDELKVAPIQKVSRAEERGPEVSIRERPLRDRLCDCAFARPSQPIQPVDRRFIEIPFPEFDLIQDCSTGSLQTTFTIAMQIFGGPGTGEITEDGRFSC